LVQQRAAKTRIVKFVVPQGDRIAIGYWGGTVQWYTRAGDPLAAIDLPQDLTGMIWCGERVAVGLADGRICWLAL